MNFLALFEDEYQQAQITITGERARHLTRIHSIEKGKEYNLACIDKGLAIGQIEYVDADKVVINRNEIKYTKHVINIKLVIGACRPQSVKKILQLAIAYGVENIVFVGTELSHKSYLSAKILEQREVQLAVMLEAIEQSGQVYLPRIEVLPNFRQLQINVVQELEVRSQCFLADINGRIAKSLVPVNEDSCICLLIGPEKGWCEAEKEYFEYLGASKVRLAPGVLRVEQATAAFLALAFSSAGNI